MRNLKKNTHTLTEGSIWKGILLFALPLLGSSLIQQLYSTVDLIFVGQLLGTKASAAIGASGLIVTCLIGFFNGMAVGTNVFAARHYGAKRFNELKKLIQTIFWTGIIGGFIINGDWIDIFSNLFNMDGNAEKYFSAGGTLSANLYGEHDIHSQLQPVKRSIESVRRLENTVTVSVLWWNHQCIC